MNCPYRHTQLGTGAAKQVIPACEFVSRHRRDLLVSRGAPGVFLGHPPDRYGYTVFVKSSGGLHVKQNGYLKLQWWYYYLY